jgi:hypothetical protein
VHGCDVDGDGGEPEQGHEEEGDGDRDGPALPLEAAAPAGEPVADQPPHRMAAVPVRSTPTPLRKPETKGWW